MGRNRNYEANTLNIGHRRRFKILDNEWRCWCSACGGHIGGNKFKSARVKKKGKLRRVKPPWKESEEKKDA